MMELNFTGKTVLVTGAAQGAGKVIAQKFYESGAVVIAADLHKPTWNESCTPGRVYGVEMDVSDEQCVESTLDAVTKQAGEIDIVVNNAGIAIESPLKDFETKTWNKIFAVNANGTFYCTRYVVRGLLARGVGGRIVNIASIAGKNGFASTSAYCASKAAVIGFTRGLAAELGAYDIGVNAICPGSVQTAMIERVIDRISANTGKTREDVRTMMQSGIPMKRFQQPEDVAALAMFLASDLAKNINGESINLDGGVVRD